jgi:hypothetical protein
MSQGRGKVEDPVKRPAGRKQIGQWFRVSKVDSMGSDAGG